MVASIQIAISSNIVVIDQCLYEPRLSKNQKLLLFRIIQEQLNNILKYAKASVVVIHGGSLSSGSASSIASPVGGLKAPRALAALQKIK